MAELGHLADLFPSEDVGVAQGCCLSPLIGNIYLEEFDKKMNDRGITCLRYMDDFLLLGPTEKKVRRAFESARKFLNGMGLDIFDPVTNKNKAQAGKAGRHGISFLGCEIYPNQVYPEKASRDRIIEKIRDRLDKSIARMSKPDSMWKEKISVSQILYYVDNVLRAWGSTYTFCNHTAIFRQLDEKVDELLDQYFQRYRIAKGKIRQDVRRINRRILGIYLLEDTKEVFISDG